ncbi:TPM domain-containing protein [Psittacicella hinzii]|uniref:TPM domain-containing protein n=1 Tax=Psittacicella hinzii TaxID=2028575 RepID=UPI001CA722A1|nr:TPM domain-containing protein [Psittacicella hinzii]
MVFSINNAFSLNLPKVPQNLQPANDYTNTLTAQQLATLNQKLDAFNQKGQAIIVLVLVPTTEGLKVSDYAFKLMNSWKIGDKEKQNGLLLLVAMEDRKYFFAPGPGIEGVLTDALLGSIQRHYLKPAFQEGNYYAGLNQSIDVIMQTIAGEIPESVQKVLAQESDESILDYVVPAFIFLMIGVILFYVFIADYAYRFTKNKSRPTTNNRMANMFLNVLWLIGSIEQSNRAKRREHQRNNRDNDRNDGFKGFTNFGGGGFGGGGSRGGGAGGSW